MSGETRGVTPERQAVAITDRPLNVIDLLDGAFAALRYRPRVVFFSMLWIVIPAALIEGWNSRGVLGGGGLLGVINDPTLLQEASDSSGYATSVFAYGVDWLRVSFIGVSMAFMVDRWAHGEDPSVKDVMWFTVRRAPVWLAAFLLGKLIIGVTGWLVVPWVMFALGFALLSPVLAIEGLGPIKSLKRSFKLMRLRTSQILGLYLACALVGFCVSGALTAIPSTVALVIGTDRAWPLVTIGSIISTSLLAPFNGAAMALMYHDVRFRSEGLDLKHRADHVFAGSSYLHPTAPVSASDRGSSVG